MGAHEGLIRESEATPARHIQHPELYSYLNLRLE